MSTEQEESGAVQILPEIIDQREAALIDRQISTARAYPRNITRATNNSIAVATIDKETAETCIYAIQRGGKRISGPSVHLAKILAQNWGNLRIEARVISTEGKQVTSMGVCWDLETNLAVRMEVRRSIMDKNGKRYSDDMVVVTGNASNSISLRNAVFAVIPKAIVDKVVKAAKETILGDVSDKTKLIARRKEVIDKLKDTYNVTEEEILKAVGKASIEHIDADDLVDLIGIGTAIKDGDTTVEASFRGKQTKDAQDEITKDDLAGLLIEREKFMDPKVKADAYRILGLHPNTNAPETKSFKKLHKALLEIKLPES